jgi:hypothetical protein
MNHCCNYSVIICIISYAIVQSVLTWWHQVDITVHSKQRPFASYCSERTVSTITWSGSMLLFCIQHQWSCCVLHVRLPNMESWQHTCNNYNSKCKLFLDICVASSRKFWMQSWCHCSTSSFDYGTQSKGLSIQHPIPGGTYSWLDLWICWADLFWCQGWDQSHCVSLQSCSETS